MRLTDFALLSFDCYGTLIDWEAGILAALSPLLARLSPAPAAEAVLQAFAGHESAQQAATPDMAYPDVLRHVHQRLAADWGASTDPGLDKAFCASIADWPPFADTVTALAYLKQHFKLVILSNVDRASFAHSQRSLAVAFDAIYTAQDIGSYKPSSANFAYLTDHVQTDFGLAKSDILHVAQSLYHDHVPAEKAGIARVWIDRRHGRVGGGATKLPDPMPSVDFRFTDLAGLAASHRLELA